MNKQLAIAILSLLFTLPGCHHDMRSTTSYAPIPDISVTYNHSLTGPESRLAAEALAKSLEKYGMQWSWDYPSIAFRATRGILNGTHGVLTLKPHSVAVNVYSFPPFIPQSFAVPRIKGKITTHFPPP